MSHAARMRSLVEEVISIEEGIQTESDLSDYVTGLCEHLEREGYWVAESFDLSDFVYSLESLLEDDTTEKVPPHEQPTKVGEPTGMTGNIRAGRPKPVPKAKPAPSAIKSKLKTGLSAIKGAVSRGIGMLTPKSVRQKVIRKHEQGIRAAIDDEHNPHKVPDPENKKRFVASWQAKAQALKKYDPEAHKRASAAASEYGGDEYGNKEDAERHWDNVSTLALGQRIRKQARDRAKGERARTNRGEVSASSAPTIMSGTGGRSDSVSAAPKSVGGNDVGTKKTPPPSQWKTK